MRKAFLILAILLLPLGIQAQTYNVRDYDAKGDGKTLDHIAINKAIDACVADGGGHSWHRHCYSSRGKALARSRQRFVVPTSDISQGCSGRGLERVAGTSN